MNKISQIGVCVLLSMLVIFLSTCEHNDVLTQDRVIKGEDYDSEGGADSYNGAGNHPSSPYFKHLDFFSLKSGGNLTILPEFKTMQQTTEWSCGDVAALMILEHYGCRDTTTEWNLAVAMHSHVDRTQPDAVPGTAQRYIDYGTKIEDLYKYFFTHKVLKVYDSSYRTDYTDADLLKAEDLIPPSDVGNLPGRFHPEEFSQYVQDQLKANRIMMVEWGEWDGHWVDIIGYDNMGTPDILGDDVLIFADPYDTFDHQQDGYSIAALEFFFYMWADRAIAPKPYQLQPFLVVGKR